MSFEMEIDNFSFNLLAIPLVKSTEKNHFHNSACTLTRDILAMEFKLINFFEEIEEKRLIDWRADFPAAYSNFSYISPCSGKIGREQKEERYA